MSTPPSAPAVDFASARLILADREGPFRDALTAGLNDAFIWPLVTDDGRLVRQALADEARFRTVVVVGHELVGLGALEAIWSAYADRARTGAVVRHRTMLVTDLRSDVEMLELLRKRGVNSFIYRDAPIEKIVHQIGGAVFEEQRVAPRHALKISGTVTLGEARLPAVLEDLSNSGAQVAVAMRKLVAPPAQGMSIRVQFKLDELEIDVGAIVRRLTVRKALLGDRMVFGVQFELATFDARKSVELAVKRVSVRDPEGLSLLGAGWRGDEPMTGGGDHD